MRSSLMVTFAGQTRSLRYWARACDIPYDLLYGRIYKLHWPVERAFSERAPEPRTRRGRITVEVPALLAPYDAREVTAAR